MRFLSISDSKVSDLSPLGGLTNLTSLGFGINHVFDLLPLVGLINLREVNVQSNPLNPKTIAVELPLLEAKGVDVIHSYQ
ncbi:hypothetical protein F4X33_09215 [Candidatus Poribacteria bacterium]|nr:hypothetical protein [Candidatus Poribacteria bacterium]